MWQGEAKGRKAKALFFTLFVIITLVFCFDSPYPETMMLHHAATVLAAAFLIFVLVRNNLSQLSFLAIIVFIWLHAIGAKWTYLYVPYDSWWKFISGRTLSECFAWQRNQYDRFVHLFYGVLIWIPAREIFHRWYRFNKGAAAFAAWQFIAMSSLMYELFEWWLTLIAPAAQAENYNGQQGDIWDAQKDMALAVTGALFSWFIALVYRIIQVKHKRKFR